MDRITECIASFASRLNYDDIPDEVLAMGRHCLVDALACGIAAVNCDQAEMGRRLAVGVASGSIRGRVIGAEQRTTPMMAAFVNTAMIRNLDFNDFYPGGHPSDVLGAILAVAESVKASGRRLLTSMIVSYETFIAISDSAKLRERGWDQGYAIGIATAAGLGSLLGLDPTAAANAISLAAVGNVPLRATRAGHLSHWKGAATAYAVHNAMFTTLLAAEGMTGPERPFQGRHGLWEQITGPFELDRFEQLGVHFLTPNTRLKYWPVEYNAQAAVWAALELRKLVPVEDIESIQIRVYWSAWHEIASEPEKWDPKSRETADHSLPYIFARTLVSGSIDLTSFDEQAYLDPSLRPIMTKVSVKQDDEIEALWPTTVAMRVDATDRKGGHHALTVENPLGHEKNPLSGAQVKQKFVELTTPILGEARAKTACDYWWHPELTELSEAFRSISVALKSHN
ncbi:MAG: MmgE/PrpD family protein [Trueperaceae bacterium]